MSFSKSNNRESRRSKSNVDNDSLSVHNKWIIKTGISHDKWLQIEEDEENMMVVMYVREKLLDHVMDIVYENYLEKQINPFIVECSYMAWKKLISWYYQRKDPGEPKGTDSDAWKEDIEPSPSKTDACASYIIPVMHGTCDKHRPRHTSLSRVDSWRQFSPKSVSLEVPQVSREVSSLKTPTTPTKFRKRIKQSPASNIGPDDFVKTAVQSNKTSVYEENLNKEFPPKSFPSSRIDILYAVNPDNRAKSTIFKIGPVVKNITLQKSIEKDDTK